MLNPELRERLWPFLGGIAKQTAIPPRCIGGVAEHVHLLLSLPITAPIAKAIQLVKAGSSAWIHQTFRQRHNFSQLQGYGAFRVSVSQLPETIHDIQNQVEDHRTRTFQQEYLAFLKLHEHSTHSTRCRLLRAGALFAHAGAQFRRQISVGLTMPSTSPSPLNRDTAPLQRAIPGTNFRVPFRTDSENRNVIAGIVRRVRVLRCGIYGHWNRPDRRILSK